MLLPLSLEFELCRQFPLPCIVLENSKSIIFEEELSRDAIEFMTVFSARFFGGHSNPNRKADALWQ